MDISAKPVSVQDILLWRDFYRQEMNCQIVHDSLHARPGWTEQFLFEAGGRPAGYGSLVVGGPWKGTRTVFELYVLPQRRARLFDFFSSLLDASQATAIEAQTNDPILTVLLHAYGKNIWSEKIVFEDKLTTAHTMDGARFYRRGEPDQDWALEINGEIAATGGILYHYNRPYGDVYMNVEKSFRRRGVGSYMVQELKRVCYEQGSIPAARCNSENIASRRTLMKSGFVPCAHILNGTLEPRGPSQP